MITDRDITQIVLKVGVKVTWMFYRHFLYIHLFSFFLWTCSHNKLKDLHTSLGRLLL